MDKRLLGIAALGLGLFAGACDSTDSPEPGTFTVMLTDEEGDFTQAIVTIERVEAVGDGDPVVLADNPFTTNLLTLSNDVAALAENVIVPGGSYSQVRFVIPEACIAVEQADESELVYASEGFDECGAPDGDLQLPSFDASGLKVSLPGGSVDIDGDARVLLFDFDVSQSFGRLAGGSDMWVMSPVIRANDLSVTGSITVELTAAEGVDLTAAGGSLADFQARLDTETEPLPFADGDADGTFTATFLYLMPGEEHVVTVELQDGVTFDFTLNPSEGQAVTLESGEMGTVAFEVASAG